MENYLEQVCGAMVDDVDLRVLVANDQHRRTNELVEGVPVNRLATYGTLARTPLVPSFFSELNNPKPDIFHLHHPNPVPTLALLLEMDVRRSKLVISYQAEITHQKFLNKFFEPLLHFVCERASAIIASSPNMIEHSKFLAAHREKCHVIPLPISAADWDRGTNIKNAATLRAEAKRPVVLSVGRLVYYKGFEYLIAAMAKVNADLWIVGEGPQRAHLEQCIRDAGVQDKVKLLGKVDRVQDYYAAADIFALASINEAEAYGIVQMEAMASRLPVVNTSLPSGVPYVSRSNESGLTVPPRDIDALASAINSLLGNESMRCEFGEAARRRVETEFDIQRVKERTLELYYRVTGAELDTVVSVESPALAL